MKIKAARALGPDATVQPGGHLEIEGLAPTPDSREPGLFQDHSISL